MQAPHIMEHSSGNTSDALAAKRQELQRLDNVPEPTRTVWKNRLASKEGHARFSVSLELYLYNYFRERGWAAEIEPELPGTRNRPDFVVTTGDIEMIIEAKSVLGAKSERQQDDRLARLAKDLSGKLNHTVSIHPMLDLPPSLPNRRIAADINRQISRVDLYQEILIDGEHQGQRYALEVTLILDDKPAPTSDVGSTLGQVVDVDIGQPVREAIKAKANKFCDLSSPFLVAVWPKLPYHFSFEDDDDLVALYGAKDWKESWFGEFTEIVLPNGVFTIKRDDLKHYYSHVSAVLFCHPDKPGSLRVYHNPFAERPVAMDVFKGTSQCTVDRMTRKARWVHH